MKKLVALFISLLLTFSLVACSSNTVDKDSVKYYFDTYEVLGYSGSEKGMVYILDDGSENGMAIAVPLTEDQMNRIEELDFFSDTYSQDTINIVEESKEFKTYELDDYVPNLSDFDKYVGQKLEILMNDGYEIMGHNISDNYTGLYLSGSSYEFEVEVEELVDLTKAEYLSDDDCKDFTIKSFIFEGFSSEFYNTLY